MRGRSLALAAAGIVAAALGWWWLSRLLPADPAAASMAERLGIAAAALLPGAGVLAAMVLAQMGARFLTGALDPTLGRDGRFLLLNQRALTNTVEQMAVFAPALLALAAGSRPAAMPGVEAAGLVFAAARLVFWGGYLLAPILRAPGMAATASLSVATLLAASWAWSG